METVSPSESPSRRVRLIALSVILFIAVTLIILTLWFSAHPLEEVGGPSKTSNIALNTPAVAPQSTPFTGISNETPAGYLAQARIYLNGNVSEYDLSQAKSRLELIPKSAPQYEEAQRLLAEIKVKEVAIKTSAPANSQPANQSLTAEENAIRQSILAADQTITYEQLTKNADRYQRKTWAFRGAIIQIQESGGQTSALVALDVLHDKIMKVQANFTTNFVEKDQVYVVGSLAGNYSYNSQANWNITVPLINASAIIKPSDAARLKAGKGISK